MQYIDPTEYSLFFASTGFKWSGQSAVDLPLLCDREGAIHEPAVRYFGFRFRNQEVAISSLRDEAYIIREWLAYLASRGLRWDQADDQVMIEWREEQEKPKPKRPKKLEIQHEPAEVKLDETRIGRKLHVVFTFYDKLPAALNRKERIFVSRDGPITLRDPAETAESRVFKIERIVKRSGDNNREWQHAKRKGSSRTTRRPTPDVDAVDKVLAYLRNSTNGHLGDRNWLIGRCHAEAGLRRHEVARLTVRMLEAALKREYKMQLPTPQDEKAKEKAFAEGWNPDPRLAVLEACARWSQGQKVIIDNLERLRRSERAHIYLQINGKGGVIREAPFPLDLIISLLQDGIWGVRRVQIEQVSAKLSYRPPPNIFLSEKTKGALGAEAIGNMMKDAFNALQVDASGHRLRAHFATMLAARVWNENFRLNGYRWDQTVVNMTLDEVARAMGHKRVNTAVRYYVDLVLMRQFSAGKKDKLKDLRKFWSTFAQVQPTLTPEDIQTIHAVSQRLAQLGSDKASLLRDTINLHLADPDMQPHPSTANGETPEGTIGHHKGPTLQIITKNQNV